MTRAPTNLEAIEFFDTCFNIAPDNLGRGRFQATVVDVEDDDARSDWESYLAILPGDIDRDAAEFKPHSVMGLEAVTITISTGE